MALASQWLYGSFGSSSTGSGGRSRSTASSDGAHYQWLPCLADGIRAAGTASLMSQPASPALGSLGWAASKVDSKFRCTCVRVRGWAGYFTCGALDLCPGYFHSMACQSCREKPHFAFVDKCTALGLSCNGGKAPGDKHTCCSKVAEAETAVSGNEKKWLVMHMHVQLKLDLLRCPPKPSTPLSGQGMEWRCTCLWV